MTRLLMPFLTALAMTVASHATAAPKRVALVFDDGPVPQGEKLLAFFEKEAIHVTFAQVANLMEQHPEISRAMLAAGHEIANHSYRHAHPADLSDEELAHEIGGAQSVMTEILGVAPRWYWPPFLEVDERVETAVSKAGLQLYPRHPLVSSDDWNRDVTAEQIRERATTNVSDGAVVLFHEWREETYDKLPEIIAELRRQGCEFLTFSELREYTKSLAIE